MKRILCFALLVLLVGCGGTTPVPQTEWEIYVHEVMAFENHFGVHENFWYSAGPVTETGFCEIAYGPETYESMAVSTRTTGLWERCDEKADLASLTYYASEGEGVWVLPSYQGQVVYVAWVEE